MHTGLFCPNCLRPAEALNTSCPACSYSRPSSGWPRDEFLGRTINRKYRIVSKLGEGGFGVVVRARHVQKGVDLGDVVLKFMHPHLASRYSLRRRFVNEARAARALNDPHVVKVFDLDFDERGVPYIVMEYLEGRPLSSLLKQGPVDPARTLRLGVQIAAALEICHHAGIVHRDLKPSNVLLLPARNEDFVKLIDFGIAHLPDTSLSQTMVGTPKYMPPEQIRQEPFDAGADIFALGVLLFECLAGAPPIVGRGPEYLFLNLDQRPRLLRELAPQLPEDLERLLAKMMAKERAARPASMADVEARLTAIAASQAWTGSASIGTAQTRDLPAIETTTDLPAIETTLTSLSETRSSGGPIGDGGRRSARLFWAAGLLLVAGGGVAVYLGVTGGVPVTSSAGPSTRSDAQARSGVPAPDLHGAPAATVRTPDLRGARAAVHTPDMSAEAALPVSRPNLAPRHASASPSKRSHRPVRALRPARPKTRDVNVQSTNPDDGFAKVPGL
jgi:serine/threonine protein kinase